MLKRSEEAWMTFGKSLSEGPRPIVVQWRRRLMYGSGEEREVEAYQEAGTRRTWREKAVDVLRAVMSNEADVQSLLNSIPA